MSQPFIGEVRAVSFGLTPKGWAPCNGQLMSIQQNQALFAILGTTYGGDGVTTFALPNLRGRAPVGEGNGTQLGESAGEVCRRELGQKLRSSFRRWHGWSCRRRWGRRRRRPRRRARGP